MKLQALAMLPLLFACVPDESQSTEVLTFTPVDVPSSIVQHIVDRWIAASGLPIEVGPGGVPIRMYANVVVEGVAVCGSTPSSSDEGPLEIKLTSESPPNMDCYTPEDILLHEVGHAICNFYDRRLPMCHSAKGVMAAIIVDLDIDESSLATICDHAPCSQFVPED